MITLKGKYSEAKVFTDLVDDKTVGQVVSVLNSPIADGQTVRIMPDCHAGAGCVIGTTMTVKDKVCPNLVGVDIGCGMLTTSINIHESEVNEKFLKTFDRACHNVPSGYDVHNEMPNYWKFTKFKSYENFINQLICKNNLKDKERIGKSLGTLGSGNHFIELNKDNKTGQLFIIIHSGSRNLGKQVAEYYQNLAIKKVNNHYSELNELIQSLKEQNRTQEIQSTIQEFKTKYPYISDDLAYLEGEDLKNYLHDLNLCQEFASYNRLFIYKQIEAHLINSGYKEYFDVLWSPHTFHHNIRKSILESNQIETIHNYIDIKNMILRKGAVSAQKDELLVIPMNMRDGTLFCRGLGQSDWNYSAPHGAGRLMSRAEAKSKISLDDFVDSMKDVYSTTVSQSTIDEAPMVYKPMQSIIENVKDTVEILKILKPIYNFKAAESEPSYLIKKKVK